MYTYEYKINTSRGTRTSTDPPRGHGCNEIKSDKTLLLEYNFLNFYRIHSFHQTQNHQVAISDGAIHLSHH